MAAVASRIRKKIGFETVMPDEQFLAAYYVGLRGAPGIPAAFRNQAARQVREGLVEDRRQLLRPDAFFHKAQLIIDRCHDQPIPHPPNRMFTTPLAISDGHREGG